jgi:hypothetical protein
MLDKTFEVTETHYQDIPNPDPKPDPEPKNMRYGTSGNRPAWWLISEKTHRQAIIDSVAQIVE